MVAKGHKITDVPLLKKICDKMFFFFDYYFLAIFLNSGTLIVKNNSSRLTKQRQRLT